MMNALSIFSDFAMIAWGCVMIFLGISSLSGG